MSEIKKLECEAVADFHVHPDYSIDARGSLDDFCRRAFDIGLSEICFTTHYDINPTRLEREGFIVINGQRGKVSMAAAQHYLNDVGRVREEYGKIGLLVRCGMEFGYFPGCEKELTEMQAQCQLHFRLGAVHEIDGHCMCCADEAPKLFAKYTLPQLADRYFELLDKAAASGCFDCLAHIDVYRRYGLGHYGDEVYSVHEGRIEKVFQTMAARGVGFELNTSAIRHGHQEYYPTMEIVNLARSMGVPILTLGSDAHRPDDLALDFDTASAVAYELTPYVDE